MWSSDAHSAGPAAVCVLQILSGHEPQPWSDKCLLGVLVFIGLLLVIVGPAMLFSTLNPVLNLNPIYGVSASVGTLITALLLR